MLLYTPFPTRCYFYDLFQVFATKIKFMFLNFECIHSRTSENHSFWRILDLWKSKISSTMVNEITQVNVKFGAIREHLLRCVFKIFFNHGECIHSQTSENHLFWCILDLWKSTFSSTMVNIFIHKPVEIIYSGAFETSENQNFLQPWWIHSFTTQVKIIHFGAFETSENQNFLQPWRMYPFTN